MTPESSSLKSPKPPHPIFKTIFAFPPNRDTLGATAYLILDQDSRAQRCNILVDAPAWNADTQAFLDSQGGIDWLFITHRGSIGAAAAIQQHFNCQVVVQEQEAYLLPEVTVTPFGQRFQISPQSEVFWTPGHSPGSACLYHQAYGGVLFTGRHLLPDAAGKPRPLRFSKTFHWPRQLRQVQQLQAQFSAQSLAYICPGANTGFLRGRRQIDNAWEELTAIDLDKLRHSKALL